MYLTLIDTVTQIVKSYGVGILSDSRFWHILTDSYSFASEYSLKDIFKSCLTTGYVSKMVSLRGDNKKTKDEISHIVKSESKLNPGKEQEYAAVLYSIAIAIGSCTKNNYSDLINKNNPKPIPSPNSNTSPAHNKPSNIRSIFSFFTNVLRNYLRIILAGVISVFIGTLLYGLFIFGGWWMFFVLLFIGLIQVVCSGYLIISIETASNRSLQSAIASIGFPFIIAFVVNIVISFSFQSDDFRWGVYNYFRDWQPQYAEGAARIGEIYRYTHQTADSPGFLSIMLGLFFLAMFIGAGIGLFSNTDPKPRFKVKYSLVSFAIITIVEAGIFVFPPIKHKVQEWYFMRKDANITEQMESQQNQNNRLISLRAAISKDMSFKGIKLGISWDTALGYAQSIVEADSSSQITLNKVEDEYFYTYFRNNSEIMETLTKTYSSRTPKQSDDNEWFAGKLLNFNTTLDNQGINVKVFGLDNKVYAIAITPAANSSYKTFENYNNLVDLYKRKYGDPELIRDRSYYEYDYYSDKTIYGWTFKNGIIRITKEYITYVPSSFFDLANEIATKKKREQEEADRRLNYFQFQQDSIMRAKQLADSLRHVRNHQNAINEI